MSDKIPFPGVVKNEPKEQTSTLRIDDAEQPEKRDPALTPLPGDCLEGCHVIRLHVGDGAQQVEFIKMRPVISAPAEDHEQPTINSLRIEEWRNTFAHLIQG